MNMFKRVSNVVVILLVALLIFISSTVSEVTKIDKLKFVTPDSLSLYAWLVPTSTNPRPPLVVLLHMYGHDHTTYDPFIAAVQKYYGKAGQRHLLPFPHILAFDLRGHGQSTDKRGTKIDYQDRNKEEFARIPADIAFAVNELVRDTALRIDTNNIIVIGASVGANAAVMTTELIPGVSKVVMLSPGENYIGLEPTQALKDYNGRSLIFTARNDDYSFASSKKLAELDSTRIDLKVFESENHGTNIINNNPEAMRYLLDWLFADTD